MNESIYEQFRELFLGNSLTEQEKEELGREVLMIIFNTVATGEEQRDAPLHISQLARVRFYSLED